MENEAIVELLSDIQLVSRQSVGELLRLAKEASLEGRTNDCLILGRHALRCLSANNEAAKAVLMYNRLYEWAMVEEAEGLVYRDKLCEVLATLCEVSMGVSLASKRSDVEA